MCVFDRGKRILKTEGSYETRFGTNRVAHALARWVFGNPAGRAVSGLSLY
jgi:hypothetical protein